MSLPQATLDINLKRSIASSYPDFEARATTAWHEIIKELDKLAEVIKEEGENYIPQISFDSLACLSQDEIAIIKRRGTVLIRDVVDDAQALEWKDELKKFVKVNDERGVEVEGTPENDKQFFQLYWTKPQVQARSHPNLLASIAWLNNLYHAQGAEKGIGEKNDQLANTMKGVDLSTPLSYADRFRIRKPGFQWDLHPPHVDGGTMERWEDPFFRKCFENILNGNWRDHDPFALEGRLNARNSLYGRPNQSSIFRTFQGWLAMSETAPTQGTLRVFPDVLLSNAYIILRPFFSPTVPSNSKDIYDANNWKFDISTTDFPGTDLVDGSYAGLRPTHELHPHLRLDECLISVPKVNPGDAVYWHCDVIHAVEIEHAGSGESAAMYIPAVPLTPQNQEYIERQKITFLCGDRPPDFPKGKSESAYVGVATVDDVVGKAGRIAMGLQEVY